MPPTEAFILLKSLFTAAESLAKILDLLCVLTP